MMTAEIIVTIICSVLASSGFWAFLTAWSKRNDASARMLRGLGHDRIMYLGMKYIERGYITHDEYENLHTYLYEPYEALDGNGSATRVMKEVDSLPIK